MHYCPLLYGISPKLNWVTFIVGLPGSGKTHYIKNSLNIQIPNSLVIDDPKDTFDISRGIERGGRMIIADPWLCDPSIREKALNKFVELGNWGYDVYFFENNQEKCKRNIAYRNDGRVITDLDVFKYELPKYTSTIKIWTPPD